MRILVTGGLGYLGGRISQHLVTQGHEVFASTRSPTQPLPQWLKGHGGLVALDLSSPKSEAIPQVDAVVHLAALNEIDCAASPEQSLQMNAIGTLKLIDQLKGRGVGRFLYFSTAHVYRAPLLGTFKETTPTRPTHPYSYSHRAAEDLVFAFEGKHYNKGLVVRLSNGFGYPERPEVNRWTLLVNDLCKQIATTRRIVLMSDGTQPRDFITLEDTARATEHLLTAPEALLEDGLFNVGAGSSLSVFEMATLVREVALEVLGQDLPPIERPAPKEGAVTPKLHFDVSKLQRSGFKWNANSTLEIAETLKLCLKAFAPGSK